MATVVAAEAALVVVGSTAAGAQSCISNTADPPSQSTVGQGSFYTTLFSNGEQVTYTFDFGDGTPTSTVTTGTPAFHRYTKPGTYLVKLTTNGTLAAADGSSARFPCSDTGFALQTVTVIPAATAPTTPPASGSVPSTETPGGTRARGSTETTTNRNVALPIATATGAVLLAAGGAVAEMKRRRAAAAESLESVRQDLVDRARRTLAYSEAVAHDLTTSVVRAVSPGAAGELSWNWEHSFFERYPELDTVQNHQILNGLQRVPSESKTEELLRGLSVPTNTHGTGAAQQTDSFYETVFDENGIPHMVPSEPSGGTSESTGDYG